MDENIAIGGDSGSGTPRLLGRGGHQEHENEQYDDLDDNAYIHAASSRFLLDLVGMPGLRLQRLGRVVDMD